MAERTAPLSPQFETLEQQHDTRTFGMWVFLMTELMLFGALFTAYVAYRFVYPDAFVQGSRHLDATLGAINTGVLIMSSLMMALAVHSAQLRHGKSLALFLFLTMALGTIFMGIKAVEYYQHYRDGFVPGVRWTVGGGEAGPIELFGMLYFAMTGLHAVHLSIGITIVAVISVRALLGHFNTGYYAPVEMTGLYWHFVDIIWIFLFPMLYLVAVRR